MYNLIVSIIVPIYNAENYLCKCFNSIINQIDISRDYISR